MFVVILRVHGKSDSDLSQVGKTGALARLLARLCEDWEEDGGENRDNGDDDEEFDEREACSDIGLLRIHFVISCIFECLRHRNVPTWRVSLHMTELTAISQGFHTLRRLTTL